MGFLVYFLVIMLVPLWAQFRVKGTFVKYSHVPNSTYRTGAEVAREVLNANGLFNVGVEEGRGFLSDHYDPRSKTVRLSPENYRSHSIASTAIAAHECGHAIQDAQRYAFLRFRHALVPVANIGSNFSWVLVLIGIFFQMSGLLLIGILFMAAAVLFQVITLPVEFNASNRAMDQVVTLGLIRNEEERNARKVLNAAALTYVAAAAVAVLELLRLVLIFTGMNKSND
ncbi:zinc metallopeptidase [Neobacillus niacini]|uniref:zinc metallopeptidase n=1 Tax=Neobacillus niacini TaxID=86668 RepID=UPI0020409A36|nr:zinc metallopeptidase [Neobacillus niacini]MCM3692829.1 zinc metallopeptidase [Neobacillus niacini]